MTTLPPREHAAQLLGQHGARLTGPRQRVLAALLEAASPQSHADIMQRLDATGSMDRVTVYRVLEWLVTQGLAHRIAGDDRIWRFNAGADEAHHHAHFRCTRCGQMYCLEETRPQFALNLPSGFRFQHAELTLEGLCPACP
jgi:Fur family ferric uptake transcriptional regulator